MSAVPAGRAGDRAWSLRRRLGALVAVVGLLLAVVVGASAVLLQQVREEQEVVMEDYFTAVTLSEEQFSWLLDAETAVRGYALTRDPASLEPLQNFERGDQVSGRIDAALAGDEQALAALERARGSARVWVTEWTRPSLEELQAGGELTPADVVAGQALFDQVRQDFDAYLATLAQSRDEARERLQRDTDLLFVAVLVSAVTAVGAALALWWLLRRWVGEPVADLARDARAVRDGDLSHPVTGTGPREIRDLAADVEAMRRRLVEALAAAEGTTRELRAARAGLEARSAELARSNQDLEQFAYVASHDLQEPLRKVASFCQLLQKRYGGQLDERADQYIGFAVDGAKRMQQLINDLLAFSRVGRSAAEEDGPDGALATADLGSCLDRALASLETAVRESGARVTADPLPAVPGNAALLTQLLQNLVGNAVKFRSPDRPPQVHLSAARDGDSWVLSCTDNGIGIEPRYAERVFVIFQRLHAKEVYGGTGIGLAMCKRIVEHHGGQIWVVPPQGEGTTIRWTLPVEPGRRPVLVAPAQEAPVPAAAGGRSGHGS